MSEFAGPEHLSEWKRGTEDLVSEPVGRPHILPVPVVSFPTIVTTRRVVPNQFPIAEPTPYRIAIVGESPGEDEENHGIPFVGKSGQFLNHILRDVGIDRNRCFVGNICQVRPPGNEINRFPWDGEEIQTGISKLTNDLTTFSPHITVLLGGTPLRAAKGLGPKITKWRGSLFRSNLAGPFYNRKCIPSLHPAFILREFSGFPLLKFDLKRAAAEGLSPDLILPQRELLTNLDASTLCHIMDTWPSDQRCCVDIEGGLPNSHVNDGVRKDSKKRRHIGWRCVALSARPTKAFAIPWWKFNEDDHGWLLQSFARLMYRLDVPKVLQNGLYDNFVLTYGYNILIRHVAEETMLKSWEIYAELPRALSTQASIWTREPHWKDEEMYESTGEALAVGCCKDVAVTLEICQAQDNVLQPRQREHYYKMTELLNPFHYMEQRGMLYDKENAKKKLEEIQGQLDSVRSRLEEAAGYDLCGKTSLSNTKLKKCLYQEKGYPSQYEKEFGRRTTKLTTDIEALLTLKRGRETDTLLSDILLHRHLEGIRETLGIETDFDGRVRCRYSLEAETGRVKCYTSPTGSGANLQTIQKSLRGNYIADPGFDYFQCDLEGADGWTVAAHCARLGDPTMLDDYLAGMKPAKILGLLYWLGSDVNKVSRPDLKWLHDEVFPVVKKEAGEWLYLGCKRVYHGTDYLMGIPTMQLNVLKDSFKESGTPIYIDHADAKQLQTGCMLARYPGVPRWHQWAEATLVSQGTLTSASGHTRIFFGRRFGSGLHETVKEFLAHEPQNNTTWATSLALLRLWNDPANRVLEVHPFGLRACDGVLHLWGDRRPAGGQWLPGSLLIEPLHQVHDALNGQWPIFLRDWARAKVRTYFQNPITIAGTTLTIPFDGAYGPSWGNHPNPL